MLRDFPQIPTHFMPYNKMNIAQKEVKPSRALHLASPHEISMQLKSK